MTDEGEKVGFSRARLIAHPGHERETQFIETNTCFLVSARKSHLTTHKNSDPTINKVFVSIDGLTQREGIYNRVLARAGLVPAGVKNEAQQCTYRYTITYF